ncbi:MAG: methyltransferase type 11, partial [Hylemonella sp.]|nr:methyltransferase type 11 [Hylemonella sp.]
LLRHRAQLYRRGLAQGFKSLGGGVWLSRQAEVPLFELECADGR